MSSSPPIPPPSSEPGNPPPASWGNISDRHWSRARKQDNQEALEYYRQRSQAPGVREGGSERNHYCMQCDGVVPYAAGLTHCPHCGAGLEGAVKRYFNWVEVDSPRPSDARALLPLALAGLGTCALVVLLLWWWWA